MNQRLLPPGGWCLRGTHTAMQPVGGQCADPFAVTDPRLCLEEADGPAHLCPKCLGESQTLQPHTQANTPKGSPGEAAGAAQPDATHQPGLGPALPSVWIFRWDPELHFLWNAPSVTSVPSLKKKKEERTHKGILLSKQSCPTRAKSMGVGRGELGVRTRRLPERDGAGPWAGLSLGFPSCQRNRSGQTLQRSDPGARSSALPQHSLTRDESHSPTMGGQRWAGIVPGFPFLSRNFHFSTKRGWGGGGRAARKCLRVSSHFFSFMTDPLLTPFAPWALHLCLVTPSLETHTRTLQP